MQSPALPTPAPHFALTSNLQVTKWPAMKKWSRAYLKKAFKGGMVRPRIASLRGCFMVLPWGLIHSSRKHAVPIHTVV